MIKNIMEDIVGECLTEILKDTNIKVCKCQKCISDIMALTLNHVKPKYVSTKKGEIYTRVELQNSQLKVDLMDTIIKSILIVARNPRHNQKIDKIQRIDKIEKID